MLYRTEGAPVVGLRLFQVYGPGQPAATVLGAALAAARAGQDFPMTAGEQIRDWVYIDDVVEGLLAAALAPDVEGESFELGTGVGYTLAEVVSRLFELAGAQGRPRLGALPYRPGEVMRLIAEAEAARQRLGWTPKVGLVEGLNCLVLDDTRGPRGG
jgi:nucleoside-diphosphate-sugar epimerase